MRVWQVPFEEYTKCNQPVYGKKYILVDPKKVPPTIENVSTEFSNDLSKTFQLYFLWVWLRKVKKSDQIIHYWAGFCSIQQY